jgi:hypothetical protein
LYGGCFVEVSLGVLQGSKTVVRMKADKKGV